MIMDWHIPRISRTEASVAEDEVAVDSDEPFLMELMSSRNPYTAICLPSVALRYHKMMVPYHKCKKIVEYVLCKDTLSQNQNQRLLQPIVTLYDWVKCCQHPLCTTQRQERQVIQCLADLQYRTPLVTATTKWTITQTVPPPLPPLTLLMFSVSISVWGHSFPSRSRRSRK
jgi:hypothetical protein